MVYCSVLKASSPSSIRSPEKPLEASPSKGSLSGFTLVELLVVIGIMAMMLALAGPALNAFKGSGDLTKGASDIQGFLQQARLKAILLNTYVYVGMKEVDPLDSSSSNGVGRLLVAAIASTDGQRPFTNLPTIVGGTNITVVGKLQKIDGIHIEGKPLYNNASLDKRPAADVGFGSMDSQAAISWPLGSVPKYVMTKVIEFDPRGIARVQTGSEPDTSVSQYIEIPLMPVRGGRVASNSPNTTVLQLDGITGSVQIYRPE